MRLPGCGDLLARMWAWTMRPRQDPLDQRFDTAAARLAAEQPRLDDARVVDDEQIAFAQQLRKVAEAPVARGRPGAVEQT